TKAHTMVGRGRKPVVGRLPHGTSIRVAEVIVGHTDRAPRVDGHLRREGGFAIGVAGHCWPDPGRPAVGGPGDHDLVAGYASESSVLPDHVQISVAHIDGD